MECAVHSTKESYFLSNIWCQISFFKVLEVKMCVSCFKGCCIFLLKTTIYVLVCWPSSPCPCICFFPLRTSAVMNNFEPDVVFLKQLGIKGTPYVLSDEMSFQDKRGITFSHIRYNLGQCTGIVSFLLMGTVRYGMSAVTIMPQLIARPPLSTLV